MVMADATTQDMPVFGPDGKMLGNQTSIQGQPPAPSAFDQSWTNPLDNLGAMPAFDYGKVTAAKKGVLQKELGEVSGVMGQTEAAENKYRAIADKKFQQLESFDPNQIKPWNIEEEEKKYKDDPFSAFGSFAMIASLGLAAFTKTPFINSMNAMAGVIEGRKEANDQKYERAYKAWQENSKLMLERFNIVKAQVGDAVDLMKVQGELGKTKLANTLTKYGLMQDLALLNAGYDDVLAQKWVAQAKAMEGMAEAKDNIERLHSQREAIRTEDDRRKALGMPPMSPQEKVEMQNYLSKDHTPEQAAFNDAWHTFVREHPDATADEKAAFMQKARSYGRTLTAKTANQAMTAFQQQIPDLSPSEQAIIETTLGTKGTKAPQIVSKMTEAMDQIVAAKDAGTPMDSAKRAELLRQAAAMGGSEKDQQGLQLAAENWIKTGQFPSRNWDANQKILTMANQMLKDQGIDPKDLPKLQQEFKSQQVAIQRYLSGPQGQQTTGINMAEHHIETLRQITAALDNGDFTLANWIGNKVARELGRPEPNNATLAAQIVGTEIVRAMGIAGAGTAEERGGIGGALASDSASPEQMAGAADTAEKLLAGKLFSLRLAFPIATGLPLDRYDGMLSNRTKSILFPLIGEDKPKGAITDAPPVNLLQEGVVTKFKNGTSWMLKDGKPVKVTQ
jgi:hypothetical protein